MCRSKAQQKRVVSWGGHDIGSARDWIPACSMGVAEDAGAGDSTLRTKFLEQRRHDFLLLLHQLLTSPSPSPSSPKSKFRLLLFDTPFTLVAFWFFALIHPQCSHKDSPEA